MEELGFCRFAVFQNKMAAENKDYTSQNPLQRGWVM